MGSARAGGRAALGQCAWMGEGDAGPKLSSLPRRGEAEREEPACADRPAKAPSPGTDSVPVDVQTVTQRLSGVYSFPCPFLKSSPRMEIKQSLLLET